MMRVLRDVRLIPIVLVATICLFAAQGLRARLRRRLYARRAHRPQPQGTPSRAAGPRCGFLPRCGRRWSRRESGGSISPPPATTSPGRSKKDEKKVEKKRENKDKRSRKSPAEPKLTTSDKPPGPPKVEVGNVSVPIEAGHIASAGERAVLERLRDRNQELDARRRELDMRENLIKAAEKRLEAKVGELKDTEAAGQYRHRHPRQGGSRPLQQHRCHVREHEAEGRRAHFRPARRSISWSTSPPRSIRARCRTFLPRCRRMRPSGSPSNSPTAPEPGPSRPGADQLPKIEGKPVAQ